MLFYPLLNYRLVFHYLEPQGRSPRDMTSGEYFVFFGLAFGCGEVLEQVIRKRIVISTWWT